MRERLGKVVREHNRFREGEEWATRNRAKLALGALGVVVAAGAGLGYVAGRMFHRCGIRGIRVLGKLLNIEEA